MYQQYARAVKEWLLFASYHTRNDCLLGLHCMTVFIYRMLHFQAGSARSRLQATARRCWPATAIVDGKGQPPAIETPG